MGEQIFFIKKKEQIQKQIVNVSNRPKQIKPSPDQTAIGQKIDPNWYASVSIITKPIPVSSVINLKKNQANRTAYTPNFGGVLVLCLRILSAASI